MKSWGKSFQVPLNGLDEDTSLYSVKCSQVGVEQDLLLTDQQNRPLDLINENKGSLT